MEYANIVAEVKAVLRSSLPPPFDPDLLRDDEPLWEGRFSLGSMAAMEILGSLEDRFGIEFPDQALNLSLFDSVQRLASTVCNLLGPEPPQCLPE